MAGKQTHQVAEWAGQMGENYRSRNPHSLADYDLLYRKDYGITRMSMNEEFLHDVPKDISILEVGANVGLQLMFLKQQGFKDLLGVDINEAAVREAKNISPEVDVIRGSGFDLPFKDDSFDLVYTSGVLIHISPKDVGEILHEIYRVSRRYIWGFEYYAPTYTEVKYRGDSDLLWKTDFAALYQEKFPDLVVVREHKYVMTDGERMTQMFLLEKKS